MNKTENTPLITVITPAYNRASYLDETIVSVLGQGYPNLEYIVLDDGSTDNTRDVLAGYDGRIRWESHTNMGETRTVNKGLSMATGDIVGVVNSDDPLLPGALKAVAGRFMSDPELLVVYPDWNNIDKDGNIIRHVVSNDYSYVEMLSRFQCFPGPAAFFRRKVIESLNGRDPRFRYVADFDFWLRAGMLGPFARIPMTLATFRTHPDSASVSQKGRLIADEEILLVKKVFSMPELPAVARSYRVRHKAYSNAYFKAGYLCGDGLVGLRARYYLTSMLYSPGQYFSGEMWRFELVVPAFLGSLYPPLRPVISKVYRLVKLARAEMSKLR